MIPREILKKIRQIEIRTNRSGVVASRIICFTLLLSALIHHMAGLPDSEGKKLNNE
jgi:hypothetical protein